MRVWRNQDRREMGKQTHLGKNSPPQTFPRLKRFFSSQLLLSPFAAFKKFPFSFLFRRGGEIITGSDGAVVRREEGEIGGAQMMPAVKEGRETLQRRQLHLPYFPL